MPDVEWPQSFSAIPALGLLFSQTDVMPLRHWSQPPQAMGNGTTTRSPSLQVADALAGLDDLAHELVAQDVARAASSARSRRRGAGPEPQIAVEVTRMIASRSLRIVGSGTSRTSTVLRPIQQVAFTSCLLSRWLRGGSGRLG
jgi:hypothetical protein